MTKCYAQHAVNLWSQNRGLLFRVSDIGDANNFVHKSPAHWYPKPEELDDHGVNVNVDGRFLLDLTNESSPVMQVNGGAAKDLAIAHYAKVVLPTDIEIFVGWMLHINKENLHWSECFVWKLDIKGAFPRFNFDKHSAMLLGVFVGVGILFIFTHGMFGWTGCPSVFQVIATALLRMLNSRIKGVLHLYVDDFMGFGTLEQCLHDQSITVLGSQEVFGDDAIANNKTVEPTKSAVILGWDVSITDLGIWIRPPTKAINKILFVFFCFDENVGQPLNLWEVVSSIAERYSNGILGARPLLRSAITQTNECCITSLQFLYNCHFRGEVLY